MFSWRSLLSLPAFHICRARSYLLAPLRDCGLLGVPIDVRHWPLPLLCGNANGSVVLWGGERVPAEAAVAA